MAAVHNNPSRSYIEYGENGNKILHSSKINEPIEMGITDNIRAWGGTIEDVERPYTAQSGYYNEDGEFIEPSFNEET